MCVTDWGVTLKNFANLRTSGGYEYLRAFERKSLITSGKACQLKLLGLRRNRLGYQGNRLLWPGLICPMKRLTRSSLFFFEISLHHRLDFQGPLVINAELQ